MPGLSDLRDRPEFLSVVGDRLHAAWWEDEGATRGEVDTLVGASLGPSLVPSCIVAHEAGHFLGTASLIAADLPVRPRYTPWLAAVWVEPAARRRGIGRALVGRVCEAAFSGGIERLFLYCDPDKVSFYAGLGWQVVEEGVGPKRVTILDRHPPTNVLPP